MYHLLTSKTNRLTGQTVKVTEIFASVNPYIGTGSICSVIY